MVSDRCTTQFALRSNHKAHWTGDISPKLCGLCQDMIFSEVAPHILEYSGREFQGVGMHHQTLQDLMDAVAEACYMCTSLYRELKAPGKWCNVGEDDRLALLWSYYSHGASVVVFYIEIPNRTSGLRNMDTICIWELREGRRVRMSRWIEN